MLESSLNGLLGLRGIAQVDADLLHCGTCLLHGVRKAFATLLKGSVTNLLVDAKGVFDTGSGHLLATAQTSLILSLSHVNQYPQALSDIGTRVDRDHRDTSSDSCFN